MMCMKRNELLIHGRGNDENYLYATILQKKTQLSRFSEF